MTLREIARAPKPKGTSEVADEDRLTNLRQLFSVPGCRRLSAWCLRQFH